MNSARLLRRTICRLAKEVDNHHVRISVNAMLDRSAQIKHSDLDQQLSSYAFVEVFIILFCCAYLSSVKAWKPVISFRLHMSQLLQRPVLSNSAEEDNVGMVKNTQTASQSTACLTFPLNSSALIQVYFVTKISMSHFSVSLHISITPTLSSVTILRSNDWLIYLVYWYVLKAGYNN